MDIALAKTFLEIAETGSFVAAARRLNLTQTAVSARVNTLEEQLGRRLFVRNKAGARLTSAGERFVRHATTLVQVWDRAQRQVGLPQGRVDIVGVGAELSLWNPILVDWLVWMRHAAPEIALRAEVDTPSRLLESVRNGALDIAVLYNPPAQGGGIVVELMAEEKLVMVTTDGEKDEVEDYVHVDWGPTFQASHQAAFPHLISPGVSISYGPLALLYLIRVGGTGYFRLSAVLPHLAEGRLRRIGGAPEFSYSVYMVHAGGVEPGIIDRVRRGLQASSSGQAVTA